MTYWFIGISVGIIMGLTGAGGAMISIPLFIYFLNTSLKEATVLSLIAVIFGALVGLFGSYRKTNFKYVALIAIPGVLANLITLPLKALVPNYLIAFLLLIIGAYSLFSIWREKGPDNQDINHKSSIFTFIWIGSILGITTTFTGLGGGVILLPLLIQFLKKSYDEALPISLATIALISLVSFIFQLQTVLPLIAIQEISYILMGTMTSFLLLKLFLKQMKESKILLTRRFIFTLVTVYSVISVFMKAM